MTNETLKVLRSLGTYYGFKLYRRGGKVYLRSTVLPISRIKCWNGSEWIEVPAKELPKDLLKWYKEAMGVP